ncbi:hypothetical protein PGLA_13590 [Paenibacillus glacialis]|uniref:Tyr recombinase domain-containing protein n=1 Tax=Paenibacillus glacialis TaxID=494026 RepID=A0A168KKZ7_9BACL|nr:hypothetical protein PGLA_13590 [Paenibacillus glacialis]
MKSNFTNGRSRRLLLFIKFRKVRLLEQFKQDDDYVSDYVWAQIVDNLNLIEKQYLPILLLMEATGFRLIDILSLKQVEEKFSDEENPNNLFFLRYSGRKS